MKVSLSPLKLPAGVLGTVLLCSTVSAQMNLPWTQLLTIPNEFNSVANGVRGAADGVYTAGQIFPQSGAGSAAFLQKTDLNGSSLWTSLIGLSTLATSVSVAADGVYMGGFTSSALPGQALQGSVDAFVSKYDINGNPLWTSEFGASPPFNIDHGNITEIVGVSAAADGVYVTGFTYGTLPGQTLSGSPDIFVRKYDPNGNVLWTVQFGSPNGNGTVVGVSAAADGVYVAGRTDVNFVRKYDFNGNILWTSQLETANMNVWAVSATAQGVYVAGSYGDVFLQRYDPAGNQLWSREFGTPGYTNFPFSVSATAESVYVLWQTYGHDYNNNSFLVSQYDSNGNAIQTQPVTTPLVGSGGPNAIDASTGRLYVAGATSVSCPVGLNIVGCRTAFVEFLPLLPISHVSALPPVEFTSSFIVQWSGTDPGGPGIQDYTIYVSDNGGPFTAWLTQTTSTQGSYPGVSGHTYGFYSIATDSAGIAEPPKSVAEASTLVDSAKPISHVSSLPSPETSSNFLVQWSGTDAGGPGIATYSIYVSDNGSAFTLWQANTSATQAWYSGFLGHTYGFFSQAVDSVGNVENLKAVADATTQTPATSPEDVNGDGQINCVDVDLVKASFGKKTGQPGFNPAADVNKDGVVNVLDLALVTQKLIPGTTCQ